jgi:hypothetical protein
MANGYYRRHQQPALLHCERRAGYDTGIITLAISISRRNSFRLLRAFPGKLDVLCLETTAAVSYGSTLIVTEHCYESDVDDPTKVRAMQSYIGKYSARATNSRLSAVTASQQTTGWRRVEVYQIVELLDGESAEHPCLWRCELTHS